MSAAVSQVVWTDEYRAQRRRTLGASEIAAVVGVNPYASMHNVWLSKCRGVEFEGNEATELGHELEPVILGIYCKRYGCEVRPGTYTTGPEHWMSATPDAVRLGGGLAEAKLVGVRTYWQWGACDTDEGESDAVPLHYLAQAQWQMLVTGEPFVHVIALVGTEFRKYTVRGNEGVQRSLVAKGRDFWERYVLTDTPPPVDASKGAGEMLREIYPRSGGERVIADDALEAMAAELVAARASDRAAKAARALAENRMKATLKEAGGARGKNWTLRYSTTKAGTRPFIFDSDEEE